MFCTVNKYNVKGAQYLYLQACDIPSQYKLYKP
jgi:hypothetical protein